MSGKGAKAKARGGKKTTAGKTRSAKAGLSFPVGRLASLLKKGRYAPRTGKGAPVFMAACIEYMVAELLELAGNAARDSKKSRIIPRHIQLAIKNDEELNKHLGKATITAGGVVPNCPPRTSLLKRTLSNPFDLPPPDFAIRIPFLPRRIMTRKAQHRPPNLPPGVR